MKYMSLLIFNYTLLCVARLCRWEAHLFEQIKQSEHPNLYMRSEIVVWLGTQNPDSYLLEKTGNNLCISKPLVFQAYERVVLFCPKEGTCSYLTWCGQRSKSRSDMLQTLMVAVSLCAIH